MFNIAVVGLGLGVKQHAMGLKDLEAAGRVRVKAAVDLNADRRAAFAHAYGFPVTDSIDAVLADPELDGVILVTPPSTHLPLAAKIAAAGKHLLMEKPVAIDTAAAEKLVALCRQAGIRLGINLQNRYKLATLKLRDLMDQGRLGPLLRAGAYIPLWRPQRGYYDQPGRGTLAQDGGGVLITQGIHTLDLLLAFGGPVVEVTAFAGTSPIHAIEVEDLCFGAVRFANGALGVVDATTTCYPGFPERVELSCENGTAILDGAKLTVHWKDGTVQVEAPNESVDGGADPMAFSHAFHRRRLEDFLDAVEQGRDPRPSGEDGLRVHRLIDALLLSARERRAVPIRD